MSAMRTPFFLLRCGIFFLVSSLQCQEPPTSDPALNLSPTFSEAIVLSDLGKTLERGGAFTVFAPSDKAFRELDMKFRLSDPGNRKQLRELVAYHIVAGELSASRILRALCRGEGVATFTTIQGEQLIATLQGVDIVLMDCSGNTTRIVKADAVSDNLVFHTIDRVVMPGPPIP
jgi:uncharacterized surface protein with fasciclin (FAS1) repeats